MLRSAIFATVSFGGALAVSEKCQAALDAFCAQDCFPRIGSRPCDGPMSARFSRTNSLTSGNAWRCYSPSTLQEDNATYSSGSCYCSRESQLAAVLADCESGLTRSRVFSQDIGGATCYRIPAVVQTTSGALVAFAESRHGGCGDAQVKEIAVSTSKDNGQTWSSVVHAVGPPTNAGNVGNLMPIALNDGRVALAYLYRNNGGADEGDGNGIVFSEDDGATWSEPRDITAGFGESAGTMPGPGAGVQLRHNGRLLLVSHLGQYHYDYVHYSDDLGETWSTIAQKFPGMDEPAFADLGGGEVLANFRHRDERSRGRAVARSSDGGLTWSNLSYDSALRGPICQGSLAYIGNSVYFTNPDSSSNRVNLTVKKSDDGGYSWTNSYVFQEEASAGYSSLIQGTVGSQDAGGILFESSAIGCIDFKTFPLSMSTSPPPSETCQAASDAFCAQDCFSRIESRPCDGPMHARRSGPLPAAWRCLSPSTLHSDNETYSSGSCYCTRDSELKGILADCASGLASSSAFGKGALAETKSHVFGQVPAGIAQDSPSANSAHQVKSERAHKAATRIAKRHK